MCNENEMTTRRATVSFLSVFNLGLYRSTISKDWRELSRNALTGKHVKCVNVCGGTCISWPDNIFKGTMNSGIFQQILHHNFLPFVGEQFPDVFHFYQDDDRKYTSCSTADWMRISGTLDSIMKTPASPPDLNPVENVWSVMKSYLQSQVKTKKKEE